MAERVVVKAEADPPPRRPLGQHPEQDGEDVTNCPGNEGSKYVGLTGWCSLGLPGGKARKLATGRGTLRFHDGSIYEGEFKDGLRHGHGKLTQDDGDVYEGGWRTDKPFGQGCLNFAAGGYCEGEWAHGVMHGPGVKVEPDGTKYEGQFKDDKWHGFGRLLDAAGAVIREGEWRESKEHEPPAKPATKKARYKFADQVHPPALLVPGYF